MAKTKMSIQLDDWVAGALTLESTATDVQSALAHYAMLVADAGRQLDAVLDRGEWNMLADSLNGCFALMGHDDPAVSLMPMIMLEVSDAHRLNRIGDKWFSEGQAADLAVKELLRKLEALTPLHADAIAAAVRHFWAKLDIDYKVENWWAWEHRQKYWAKGKEEK